MNGRNMILTLLLTIIMLSCVIISNVSNVQKVNAFSGSGSGTAGDPFVITTVEQLQEMKDNSQQSM